MSDSSHTEPNSDEVEEPVGKTRLPEPRVAPSPMEENQLGLRIGVDRPGDKKSTREGDVVRLLPTDSNVSRAEQKVTYSDLVHDPKRRVRNREESFEWGRKKKPISLKWVFLTVILVFGTIGWAVHYRNVLGESDAKVNPLGMPHLTIEPREGNSREERVAELLGREDEARELYARFLRAKSLQGLLEMVRIQPGVNYLANRFERSPELPADWKVPQDSKWEVYSNTTPIYGVLSGYFPDDSPFHAFMTVENGKLYVDWKASIGYGTASYAQLNAGKGDGSEIRAWVKPAVYYSPVFPEGEYRAYFLYSELDDPPVWGYAERDSDVGRQLGKLFKKSRIIEERMEPKMLLLSLAKQDEGLDNQWLIADVLHTEWIIP